MRALWRVARFYADHPLTRSAQLEAWWRFAAWQIRSRLSEEVIVPWIGGQRLVARRGMSGATGNIYAGLHEFTNMMLLLHFLRDDDLFLDIGANIGSYSVLAAGIRSARVLAFEPDPMAAGYLRRNIDLNGLGDRVSVHEIALGEAAGEVAFTIGRGACNRVARDTDSIVQLVRQERIDSILGDDGPSMAKLDVEGSEERVLLGAGDLLGRRSLRVLQIETVTPSAAETLAAHGFAEVFYDPFTRTLSEQPAGLSAHNRIFVRDRAMIGERLASAAPVEVLGHVV